MIPNSNLGTVVRVDSFHKLEIKHFRLYILWYLGIKTPNKKHFNEEQVLCKQYIIRLLEFVHSS